MQCSKKKDVSKYVLIQLELLSLPLSIVSSSPLTPFLVLAQTTLETLITVRVLRYTHTKQEKRF